MRGAGRGARGACDGGGMSESNIADNRQGVRRDRVRGCQHGSTGHRCRRGHGCVGDARPGESWCGRRVHRLGKHARFLRAVRRQAVGRGVLRRVEGGHGGVGAVRSSRSIERMPMAARTSRGCISVDSFLSVPVMRRRTSEETTFRAYRHARSEAQRRDMRARFSPHHTCCSRCVRLPAYSIEAPTDSAVRQSGPMATRGRHGVARRVILAQRASLTFTCRVPVPKILSWSVQPVQFTKPGVQCKSFVPRPAPCPFRLFATFCVELKPGAGGKPGTWPPSHTHAREMEQPSALVYSLAPAYSVPSPCARSTEQGLGHGMRNLDAERSPSLLQYMANSKCILAPLPSKRLV